VQVVDINKRMDSHLRNEELQIGEIREELKKIVNILSGSNGSKGLRTEIELLKCKVDQSSHRTEELSNSFYDMRLDAQVYKSRMIVYAMAGAFILNVVWELVKIRILR
jgi:hypothetical protein